MSGGSTLWTRDFSIITLGSVISMLGNAMSGFALSLFVLDFTGDTSLYALFMFLYTLPQIAAPVLAGPLMDKLSRRKTIYILDFFSAGLYVLMALLLHLQLLSFPLLAMAAFLVGAIHSTYLVAFNSFYPMLIPAGQYARAYSVSSTLETLTYIMLPVATFLYKAFGMFPLLIGNALCFFTAACFETQISDVETNGARPLLKEPSYTLKGYLADSKEGLRYLWSEKGLLCIALYYVFSFASEGASSVITLPWFRANFANGEYTYMSVWVFMLFGRVAGGMFHYRHKLPTRWKYALAVVLCALNGLLGGGYLYTSLWTMRMLCLLWGLSNITTFNIRQAAVQSYVPNDRKGRYNGAFLMLTTVGTLLGELLAGAAMQLLPMRETLALFMALSVLAALVFLWGGKRHIKPIYNQTV